MTRDLMQMAKLTDASLQAAQSALAVELAREKDLRASLSLLSRSRTERANTNLDIADTALIAGADGQWLAWVEKRRRLINAELSKCLVRQDHCQQIVRKAFGRNQAVAGLRKAHAATEKRRHVRRSDYTS